MRVRRVSLAIQAVIGVLLSLAVVDRGLRLIEITPLWQILPVVEPILGHPDADFGFESTPGATGVWPIENRSRVRLDALGLRDIERSLQKPPGTFRVGLLGDSMTEAVQVSQEATFGTIAERKLRTLGYNIELINLAVAGPNPIRPLLRLERRGYALALDLAVANVSANSFTAGLLLDDTENPGYVEEGEGGFVRGYTFRRRLSQRYANTVLGRWFVTAYQYSPLFRMLYLRSKQPWAALLGLSSPPAPQRARASESDSDAVCRGALAGLAPQIGLWRDHQPERVWRATARYLDDFADSTRQHGVSLIYAVRDIPLPPGNCPAVTVRRAELVAIMQSEFAKRGVRFVDWGAAVAEIAGNNIGRLHGFGVHRGTGHLNYDGHRVWAVALIGVLNASLPKSPESAASISH
jgi:hypothetical protein